MKTNYTIDQFDAALANGAYAWPGGYPLFFVTADGAALSFEAATQEADRIREAIASEDSSGGWRVVACDVNWEDAELFCDHSGKRIESAYAEDKADDSVSPPYQDRSDDSDAMAGI